MDERSLDDHSLDDLVDLHVLAENGDAAAAESAQRLLERDPNARRQWQDVERDCRLLRGDAAG